MSVRKTGPDADVGAEVEVAARPRRRGARRWRSRRGLLAVTAGAVALIGLSACDPPVGTTTIQLRADCVLRGPDGEVDLGERTFTIEMTAPEWAASGRDVTFSNLRTTHGFGDVLPDPATTQYIGVHMTTQGLSFHRELPFFVPYVPSTMTDHGSATLTVDGAPGSVATARVREIIVGDAFEWVSCRPVAGSPTRLAAVEVR